MLWAIRIPLSVWYFWLRENRFDYPSWGDSIVIGIFSDWFTWLVGATISSIVLVLLLKKYQLPTKIALVRPVSSFSWLRTFFFMLWIVILAVFVMFGIPEGDEGAVFTSIVASIILLAAMSAKEKEKASSAEQEH